MDSQPQSKDKGRRVFPHHTPLRGFHRMALSDTLFSIFLPSSKPSFKLLLNDDTHTLQLPNNNPTNNITIIFFVKEQQDYLPQILIIIIIKLIK